MTNERKEELQRQCSKFRNDLIDLLHSIQTGHPRRIPVMHGDTDVPLF